MEKACWNNSSTTGACFPREFRFCSFDDDDDYDDAVVTGF
jgi:hypothetical protein